MADAPATPALRVAITGSSGLIGSALAASLERDGHRVHRVVRSEPRRDRGEIGWDPAGGRIDAAALEGLDAVVHLASENIGERWTRAKRRRIRESRAPATRLLSEALASLARPPGVLVSASAVGYYGDRGDETLTEAAGPGDGFLAEVVREWEAATGAARQAGIRVVLLRSGAVLSRRGGALARMLPFFRLALGGRIGSGRQWMSWVSLEDAVGAIRFAIETPELRGPVNLAAPEPTRSEQFTRTLGRVLRRPTPFPMPAAGLRLVFGEMAEATLLVSQRAVPDRLQEAGYRFRHPGLEEALRAALD